MTLPGIFFLEKFCDKGQNAERQQRLLHRERGDGIAVDISPGYASVAGGRGIGRPGVGETQGLMTTQFD